MAATEKAMSAAAAAAATAVSAGREGRDQGTANETGRKRAMLRRMRRRAKAKIKSIPALMVDSSYSVGGRRGETEKSGEHNHTAADAGAAAVKGNSSSGNKRGRGGQKRRRRKKIKSKSERKSKDRNWGVGAVGSAVFGRPVRFVRRNVDACKSFVGSRERIHWASLFMATYILSTSVVPRLPAGM